MTADYYDAAGDGRGNVWHGDAVLVTWMTKMMM